MRGVALSPNIIRTLLERGWIREVGQKEVPGRPSLFGTTPQFLDDFNLTSLDDLPSLPEIKDIAALDAALVKLGELPAPEEDAEAANPDGEAATSPEAGEAAASVDVVEAVIEASGDSDDASSPDDGEVTLH